MTDVFGSEYAAAYDFLYADKDYDAECNLLEERFGAAADPVRNVLDLGCGTGSHAVRLAERGYEVVGVDLSDAMLAAARERARAAGFADLDLRQGDLRTIEIGRQFDAVICMFAVMGYQTTNSDVDQALATVRKHLRPGGVFIFDVWYGPAVEATGPSERVKSVSSGRGEIERYASASLDPDLHLCAVTYRLVRRMAGQPEQISGEIHRMRYFFADELATSLSRASLRLTELVPFPEVTTRLSTETWNALATALAVTEGLPPRQT